MRHLNTFILCLIPLTVSCGQSNTNGAAESAVYTGQSVSLQYQHIDVPGGINQILTVDNEGNAQTRTQRWCTTGCTALTNQTSNSVLHTLTGDELLTFKQQMVEAGLFSLPTSFQTSNCNVIELMQVEIAGQTVSVTVACADDLPGGVQQALSAANGVLADF